MKYRDKTNGHIYNSLYELQSKYNNVSFPIEWTKETYDYINVDLVEEVIMPVAHPYNRMDYSVEFIDDRWIEVWTEVPKYDDPTEQSSWVASYDNMQQLALQEKYPIYVATARAERNKKLSETDYTQLADLPITVECRNEFRVYRQLLRDMNFDNPFDIIWPTIPTYTVDSNLI